jgi:hypothetical protein
MWKLYFSVCRNTKTDALYNIDKESGEIRPSLMSDLTENVRIVDGLSGYDFVMSMTLPQAIDQSSSVFSKKPAITFNLVFDPG